MSVSKLCSTITGLYSGEKNISDTKYTYKYLQDVFNRLDKAIGYSALGGRRENEFPPGGSRERYEDYMRLETVRKNPPYGTKTGKVTISVHDADGKPLVSELRLIPKSDSAKLGVSTGYTNTPVNNIEDICDKIYGSHFDFGSACASHGTCEAYDAGKKINICERKKNAEETFGKHVEQTAEQHVGSIAGEDSEATKTVVKEDEETPVKDNSVCVWKNVSPSCDSEDYTWYDYFRRVTKENGTFTENIPIGTYILIVSHGSEWEIAKSEITVPGDNEITLNRIVDLAAENWYAGDLHHHSVFSSPLYPPDGTDYVYDTPEKIKNSMLARGLSYGALSDHHNTYNHRTWEKFKTSDFTPILSKEISTSNGHVLQLNTDPDIIYRIPKEEDRTPEVMRAEYIRITDEIKSYGGHPQINHPCDMQKSISYPPEFADMIDIFYTMEIWNGSHPLFDRCTNGNAMEMWMNILKSGKFIAATTGSDTHEITCEFWFDAVNYVFGMYRAVKAALANTLHAHNKNGIILEGKDLEDAAFFDLLMTDALPTVKRWALFNLSSGCVRTYVHCTQERTPKNILAELKQGHSFLTNGPILIAEIRDKAASLKIISNRPLARLIVYSDTGVPEEFALAAPVRINGGFDYSCEINLNTAGKKWFVFRIFGDDVTTEAITNPIQIEG